MDRVIYQGTATSTSRGREGKQYKQTIYASGETICDCLAWIYQGANATPPNLFYRCKHLERAIRDAGLGEALDAAGRRRSAADRYARVDRPRAPEPQAAAPEPQAAAPRAPEPGPPSARPELDGFGDDDGWLERTARRD